MAHLGAKGNTAKQIDDVFLFNNIEDAKFHSAFGELHGLMFEKVNVSSILNCYDNEELLPRGIAM